MLGIDTANEAVVKPLSSGVAMLRAARVFVRKLGPIITVNVVITNVELGSGRAGDLYTNVSLGLGEPRQDVHENPGRDESRVGPEEVAPEEDVPPTPEKPTDPAPEPGNAATMRPIAVKRSNPRHRAPRKAAD